MNGKLNHSRNSIFLQVSVWNVLITFIVTKIVTNFMEIIFEGLDKLYILSHSSIFKTIKPLMVISYKEALGAINVYF